jgi:bifunctional UDP-N-acetylglucosamine pyrophosphorylase/glucosamine-1-phosphate N-acetyltransferase
LFSALREIRPNNVQNEYYLTDVVEIAFRQGLPVAAYPVKDPHEVIGVNSQKELARVETLFQERLREHWLTAGVTMILPETIYLERKVQLASGVRLFPHVVLKGKTLIQEEAQILSFCELEDVSIGPGARVGPGVFLKGARVGPGQRVKAF